MKDKTIGSIILCLLFVMQFNTATAQTTFAPIGAKWWYSFSWNGIDFEPMYYHIESINDTVMFGQPCRHLESSILYAFSEEHVADIFVYQHGDTIFYAIDSLVGVAVDTSFHILYNFNSAAGDTWELHRGDYTGVDDILCDDNPDDYVIVDSTSTALIEGMTLKKISYHTESTDPGWGFDGDAFELIGNTTYMLPISYGCFVKDPYPGFLNCYEDPNVGIWHFSQYECAAFEEINTLPNNTVLYPNPFEEIIKIQTTLPIANITFYTIDGKELASINHPASTLSIPYAYKGICIAKMQFENNTISYIKVVKQ